MGEVRSRLTLSDLLNALDGMMAQEVPLRQGPMPVAGCLPYLTRREGADRACAT